MAEKQGKNLNIEPISEVTLKKPIVLDGTEIKKITLNFDQLTGKDITSIDREMRLEGQAAGFENIWNHDALSKLASRASGIIEEDLQKLKGPDFLEVIMRTRMFFIQW